MTEQPPAEQPATTSGSNTALAWLVGIGGLLALLCGMVALDGDDPPSDPGPDAERVCQDFVKKRLKAPASAEFTGITHTGYGSDYTVTGSVDAQNTFGATIRSTFTCQVRDAGDEWRLLSLTGLS
ncbi:hypothetical protein FJK98_02470 [Micromonospora sp. HM134]|uniref:hypothetical protein n=1 Tax=Micromonospora sp. HM134 TaxID=2583243 RepID=UPI001198CAF6|nr:hypothetical protein [Micromonospora sp. HM134]QDY06166.1 hypothetical protein FJK98_02470 [Micromonospora sp. HM134]